MQLFDSSCQCSCAGSKLFVCIALSHLHQCLRIAAPCPIPLLQEHPQGPDDGLCLILGHPALRGQLGRRALHDPAAAGLIEADDPLALLDVAAGEQKACFIVHPALLVQHDGEIRRTQDAGGCCQNNPVVIGKAAAGSEPDELEQEVIRILKELPIRKRTELLTVMYQYLDENKKKEDESLVDES